MTIDPKKIKYADIQWEDDDSEQPTSNDQQSVLQGEERFDFASALAKESIQAVKIYSGMQIEGRVISISPTSNDVLVEISPIQTGVLDKIQITNEDGTFKAQAGDKIKAYVVSKSQDEIQLSMTLSHSRQAAEDLVAAMKNRVPVRGKVAKENKGGFEVTVLGKTGFCPVSQIDTHFVANKAEYIGREFDFLITKVEYGGKNIVVSRSELLRQEAEKKFDEISAALPDAPVLSGVVREVRDFGAFIDLGGFEGFVHVSELSHSRISRIQDFLSKGDKIRVKPIRVEVKDGKRRLALSMKATSDDPWSTAVENFKEGQSYPATVVKLETFGAFVSLVPGVEGLIHVSEMSYEKRVTHPSQVLAVGDKITVRVLGINEEQKKMSLSLKDKNSDPWLSVSTQFPVNSLVQGKVERLKDFGAIIELVPGITGLLPTGTLRKAFGESFRKHASPPKEIQVSVRAIDTEHKKILLSLPNIGEDTDDAHDYKAWVEEQNKAPQTKASKDTGSFGALLAARLQQGAKP